VPAEAQSRDESLHDDALKEELLKGREDYHNRRQRKGGEGKTSSATSRTHKKASQMIEKKERRDAAGIKEEKSRKG